jgi:indole-3-glycerol phosphate synthase
MENNSRVENILDRIVEARLESIAHRKRVLPEVALKIAVGKIGPPGDFGAALLSDGFNIIAELKKASPSRGTIRAEYRPATLAPALESAGAAAFSVVTEEDFFFGSLADLKSVRAVVHVPVLRKDFIIDPWQVWEARAAGADSFLLIAAILTNGDLRELLELGRSLRMEPLVEVHSHKELDRALSTGAHIIGVNNRDLRNFEVRLQTSLDLVDAIPEDCIAVSESGLRTHEDLVLLRKAGFDAFLIGEQLMTEPDPCVPLRGLIGTVGADRMSTKL